MVDVGGIAVEQLRSYIERVERLEEEKSALLTDITEVYAEAKANGFDSGTMRKIVRMRRMDDEKLAEQEALLDLYQRALGMA